MDNALAKKTIRRINDALDKGQTGAMQEIVQVVRKLSGRIADVSIPDLSEIISRDPSITEKVISAANTFGYNPTGAEIGTITEAIHTVGFDRIRNLTLSLMLAENAGNSLDSEEQREMAALSVCSGMLAKSLTTEAEQMSVDPELAFVGGSLRNYGKLLMSTFFVDEYTQAREQAKSLTVDEAFEDVFGITPLALGHTLLKSTNLPNLVMAALEKVPQEKLERSAQSEAEEILVTAEFCSQVCELAFNESIDPDSFQKELNGIIQKFGDAMPVDFETVVHALDSVEEQMSQLNKIVGIKDSPSSQKLRSRIQGEPLPKRVKPKKTESPSPLGMVPKSSASLEDVIESMGSKVLANGKPDFSEVYRLINEAIVSELHLEGCMTFLQDDERTGGIRFSARFGIGKLFDRIKNRPLLSPEKRDVFGICLARREDILIQDTQAGKIASVIPDWIHDRGQVNSLIVLPASVEKQLFAIFVGVKVEAGIEMQPASHRRLQRFRKDLAALQGPNV